MKLLETNLYEAGVAASKYNKRKYLQHLLRLPKDQLAARFMSATTEQGLAHWVNSLDTNSRLFVIEEPRSDNWAAVCHVALGKDKVLEIALSVLPKYAGKGYATRLLARAQSWAEFYGYESAKLYCFRINAAIRRVCEKIGAELELEGPEATATLQVPAPGLYTVVSELAGQVQEQYNRLMKTLFTLPQEAQIYLVCKFYEAQQAQDIAQQKLTEAFALLSRDNYTVGFAEPFQTHMLKALQDMVHPEILDWAAYWAWDCDWGTTTHEVTINGSRFRVCDCKGLEDFLKRVMAEPQ
jgi:RimJ/RimL family protein N-acetyltransferase